MTSLENVRNDCKTQASNPGQFESDAECTFQKGSSPESIFHMGKIGVNTDRPDEALVVHGNVKLTGQVLQPSDLRAKERITEVSSLVQIYSNNLPVFLS